MSIRKGICTEFTTLNRGEMVVMNNFSYAHFILSITVLTLVGCAEVEPIASETIMLPGDVPLEMVWCPEGNFLMGSTEELANYSNECPQHQVTFASGFWMGKYELTKEQWQAVMGTTPWAGKSGVISDLDSPAVYISLKDAQEFITKTNEITGYSFRLPSEAEWEYACRAGTTSRSYWGDDADHSLVTNYAWVGMNAKDVGEDYAHIVGQKLPNAWGLYDMSGNVWEWCEDDSHGNYNGAPADGTAWLYDYNSDYGHNIIRGGSWEYGGMHCESAYRGERLQSNGWNDIGFRLLGK